MTTAAELASYASSFPSFRNRIINGAMQVAQRGTSFRYDSFGQAQFCVDRFWFYNAGSATYGNIEQSTDVPSGEGFTYSLFNDTNAQMPSGTNVELTKQGNAAPFVVGNNYTFSFWVKGSSASSGLTVSIGWRNSHANGTNATQAVATYPTFDVTTSWERVVIPFTLTTSPVSQNNTLDFEYSHPAGAKITGVQLEEGTVATPFEHRPYGTELALCQRYLPAFVGNNNMICNGAGYDSNNTRFRVVFPVQTRVPATGLVVSSAAHFSVESGSGSLTACGVLSFGSSGINGAAITANHTGGGATNAAMALFSNSASSVLYFTGCEL